MTTTTTNRRGQIEFWHYNEDGGEDLITLPTTMEVCWRCRGEGTHVNPSIDGNGLDPHDPDLDEDFWEGYMGGRYDVPCEECHGRNVLPVPDESRMSPELRAAWEEHCKDEADYAAEREAERRMGC